MNIVQKKKLKMICDPDPLVFERKYNSAIEELKDHDPQPSKVEHSDAGFWAAITYIEEEKIVETVADEFHLKGIRFTCRNCGLREITTDGRKKWCKCKYSVNGIINLDSGACEYFYRMVKQGETEPMGV